jgi:galactose oxidase
MKFEGVNSGSDRRMANLLALTMPSFWAWPVPLTMVLLLAALLSLCPKAFGGDPALVGQWSPPQTWPYRAVHASLLPNGKVLYWSQFLEGFEVELWDPVTNASTHLGRAPYNIFCAGHSFLPDGRLLLAGGHISDNNGENKATIYSPSSNSWEPLPAMNAGRWYPTNLTLPNGDVLTLAGTISNDLHGNKLPQVWQQSTRTWRNLTGALLSVPTYPRMFLAPNGKTVMAGPDVKTRYLNTSGTGSWTTIAYTNRTTTRDYGTVVMYRPGKIVTIGGDDPPSATAEIIDLNSSTPAWRYFGKMRQPRRQHNATLLPDGKVLVTGGSSGTDFDNSGAPVYAAEMWDPNATDQTLAFKLMASNTVYRGYHSITLLLPDGRVLSAGGKVGGKNTAEIFSPPYLFKGTRPTITSAPATVKYGQIFSVQTPNATSITKVSLMGLATVTHGMDAGQSFRNLTFSKTTGVLTVSAPATSTMSPPGYYMLFILANGVPSVAKVIQLQN